MTNSVWLLNLNDSLWRSRMQLLDSAEPSAGSQAVLQAGCTGMQSRRTDAVINNSSSPTLVAIKHHLKSLTSARKSQQNYLLLSTRYSLGFKAPCSQFPQLYSL